MHDIQKEVAISLTNCCLKKKVLVFKLDESGFTWIERPPCDRKAMSSNPLGVTRFIFCPSLVKLSLLSYTLMLARLVCLLGS